MDPTFVQPITTDETDMKRDLDYHSQIKVESVKVKHGGPFVNVCNAKL